MRNRRRNFWIFIIISVLAIYVGVVLSGLTETTRRSLFEFPWMWTDENGERIAFSRWRGEPVLVTAIYTQCQATCPRTISKLRKLDAAFRREGHVPEFILVTLDPRNDTPERLRRFKEGEGFPGSWHLLTGGLPETRELADLLDIHVLNADSHIMHDARIVIFDAEGMPFRRYSGWSLDEESNGALFVDPFAIPSSGIVAVH